MSLTGSGQNRPRRSAGAPVPRPFLPWAFLLLPGLLLAACAGGGGTPPPPSDGGPDLAAAEVALELVGVEGAFTQALGVVTDGASGRMYVLEQGGTVRIVEEDGTVREEPFLDLTAHDFVFAVNVPDPRDERGLLGMAFDPDDPETVYVHYNDAAGDTVVSRMEVQGFPDAPSVDPTLEDRLVEVEQDPGSTRHRGGQVAFGPDGMLYVALGDGGTGGDPAQDPSDRRGSILRIDVDATDDLLVPAPPAEPNPFADDPAGHPQVWHYGLRNPWRFSFDPVTGDLWIADVGEGGDEDGVEEVNRVEGNERSGLDFGWPRMEGDACYAVDPCPAEELGIELPDLTYRHSEGLGRSVTGGYVYRGEAIPELEGAYVFGDYIGGTILAAAVEGTGVGAPVELLGTELFVSSFGVDPEDELLVIDYAGGSLYRIVPD